MTDKKLSMNDVSAVNEGIVINPSQEFVDGIPQLYAPLENYVKGVIPLMLEHVWQLKTRNHSTAKEELMNCAWISRLITLDKRVQDKERQNEIPGWVNIRDQMVTYIDGSQHEAELTVMKNACMEIIFPIIRQRFQENYHFPPRMFHCWWYTISDDHTNLALHLVNAYQPDSPFDHLHHFSTTMLQAVQHAMTIYPDIQVVSCGSWLNQLPKFQQVWPESFQHHQKILNETGGFGPGAWGQYMTTCGGFNEKKADQLRKTGRHPFTLTEAESPLSEVTAHLKKVINETSQ